MLKCQGKRGGLTLLKRIMILCLVIMSIMGVGCVNAATPQITAINWSVNRENNLRVVLDCTQLTNAKAELTDTSLTIIVNGKLRPTIGRRYSFTGSTVKSMNVSAQGDKTILILPLKRPLKSSEYKLFLLRNNPGAKRPDRVVLDIVNGDRTVGEQKSGGIANCIIPTYSVAGGIRGKHITLDPGHGGSDPGAHGSVTGVEEKSITLPVAKKLKDILESKGVIVAMTRTTDVDVWGSDATDVQELQARVDVAEKNKADLFISVHCNANTNKNIGGFSTYYNPKTPYDEKIAEFIQNRLLKTANLRDLGTRSANLYVNKHSSMPSTLVELLFLSNAREEKLLRSNWFQNKMAQAIADGIEDFYKQNGGVS